MASWWVVSVAASGFGLVAWALTLMTYYLVSCRREMRTLERMGAATAASLREINRLTAEAGQTLDLPQSVVDPDAVASDALNQHFERLRPVMERGRDEGVYTVVSCIYMNYADGIPSWDTCITGSSILLVGVMEEGLRRLKAEISKATEDAYGD